MRFFNWVQGVIVGLNGFVADVTSDNRIKTESLIVGKSGVRAEVDPFNRVRIQLPPIALFEDNFLGDIFDKTSEGKWLEVLSGTGGSSTVVDRTLKMNLGTAIGKVELIARSSGLSASAGNFSDMIHAVSLGINRPANYRIRFGYRNTAKTDGVYYECRENTLEWYTLLNGTPTLQKDISSALTDPDISGGNLGAGSFALFLIEHLEAGKINIKIAGKQLDTTVAGGATLTGDSEKIPFLEIENTAIVSSVPSTLEMHWIKLADENGTKISLAGKTTRGLLKDITVGEDGTLPVSIITAGAPPGLTPIRVLEEDVMSGTVDTFYVIPSGDTLTIQSFSHNGDPTSNSGHVVSIYNSPTGTAADAIESNLLSPSGLSANFSTSLNFVQLGDGTHSILIRRQVLGGGSKLVGFLVTGFLTPP